MPKLHIPLPFDIPYDYIFGGAVRDTIRGVKPQDYDFLFLTKEKLNEALKNLKNFKCTELSINNDENLLNLTFEYAVRAKRRGIQYDLFLFQQTEDHEKVAIPTIINGIVDITANSGCVDEEDNLTIDEQALADVQNNVMVPVRENEAFLLGRAFNLRERGMKVSTKMVHSLILWLYDVLENPSSCHGKKYVHNDGYSNKSRTGIIAEDMLFVVGQEYMPVFLLQSDDRPLKVGKDMWNIMHGFTWSGRILRFLRLWNWVAKKNGWLVEGK